MSRTPNTECVLCAKPLYRRPFERAKVRYVACMSCRGKAQSVAGVTEAQRAGLALGSRKGFNGRTGYKHREESKRKVSAANRAYWSANPDKAKARGLKTRGPLAYNWKGGITRLNTDIRSMREYVNWSKGVRNRDGRCLRCGSTEKLEAHHTREFAHVLRDCGVKNRDDARRNAVILFDLNIGETLCRSCHYAEHGRKPRANRRDHVSTDAGALASVL